MQVMTWVYRCGTCGLDYDAPGADHSRSYFTFLGVSRNLESIIFDAFAFGGWTEFVEMLSVLRRRWPAKARSIDGEAVLDEVCDPDSHGDRYVFGGPPGCPACGSRVSDGVRETPVPWPRSPAGASHAVWNRLTADERLARLSVAFGLDPDRTADS
jgi:hypothetical protein